MNKKSVKFWGTYYKIRYYKSITKKQTETEINFIKKFLPVEKYPKILDFVCGFGRHSIALARLGYQIEGFDVDKESIKSAKFLAQKYKLKNVNFYFEDSTKFNKKNLFDATICLYSSIGFLTLKQNEKTFNNLFTSVKQGGRIILDVMNPDWAKKNLVEYTEKNIVYKQKKYLIKHKRSILDNPIREKNELVFINIKTGLSDNTSYIVYLYTIQNLEKMFYRYGFIIRKKYGSYKGGKIFKNNQRIIIIADKKFD